MTSIRPLADRVVVRRKEKDTKSSGGIVIPGTGEKPVIGEILAVGKGKRTETGTIMPLELKIGDRVLFGKYSGNEVTVNGEELLVLREDDIMGVMES